MTPSFIAELFALLELHLVASLKRNLLRHQGEEKAEGFSWPMWQAEKLAELNKFRRENKKIAGKFKSVINAETQQLLIDQYKEGFGEIKFFGIDTKKLNAQIKEVQKINLNVEKSALRAMDDVYRKTVIKATTFQTAGGVTYKQATDLATKEFLEKGITSITYKNGRKVNISTYAEMVMRTNSTRAMLAGEAERRKELGIDTVLVSQYGASSDICLPWQGKVYIEDVWGDFKGETNGDLGKSSNGKWYTLLSVAVKAGLFHPNCRHTLTTWVEGVSRMPKALDEKRIKEVSALEQRQRALEREVRKLKRLAHGTLDDTKAAGYKQEAKKAQARLKDFVDKNDNVLRRDPWRERLVAEQEEQGGIDIELNNVPEEMREIVQRELELIPKKHFGIGKRKINKIEVFDVLPEDDSGTYDIGSNEIKISISDGRKGVVVHEFAHAIENEAKLYDDKDFKKIWLNGIDDVSFDDIIEEYKKDGSPIYTFKHTKFISKYQGYIYPEFGLYDGSALSLNGMREYFSEGYREYIYNPMNLLEKDPLLYQFIKELGND